MSHLLFPIDGLVAKSSVKHKPTELPRQLFYIIRGATDAVEALELFLELLSEPSVRSDAELQSNSGYLAFDAHVGDTACQLRASMFLEVINHSTMLGSSTTIAAMQSIAVSLKKVLEAAHQLVTKLLELDWNKIRSGALNELDIIKAGLTTDELLARLGWPGVTEAIFVYDSRSASSQESLVSQACSSSMASSLSELDDGPGACSTRIQSLETSNKRDNIHGETWNPSEQEQVICFIVYSYVLSKYKQLTAFGGVYRATLEPELALGVAQKLVKHEFGRQFVRPNKRAIAEEFLSLQRYVSDLSCAWLESKARRSCTLHPQHHALLQSTIRTSAKGVSSASSYVGYLVLRSLWAENATPIIIMTTRFCPSGMPPILHETISANSSCRLSSQLLPRDHARHPRQPR